MRASLKAAAETGRRIRVFAVEKNPNAVVTLQNLVASEGCDTCQDAYNCYQATSLYQKHVVESLHSLELSPTARMQSCPDMLHLLASAHHGCTEQHHVGASDWASTLDYAGPDQ